jgi:hypothetical protein
MATEGTIGVSQPAASTITMVVRTMVQQVNGSNTHQEVMTIGGAESTLEIARVIAATPDPTAYGVVTRSFIYDGGDSHRVQPGSTTPSGAFPVRIVDRAGSSFADLGVEYTDASTTSTLAAPGLAYVNGTNATMRVVGITQPLPVQLRTGSLTYESTTAFITSTNSSAVYNLVSSGASQVKVYALSVFSTHTRPSTIVFMSSGGANGGSDIWAGQFGSGSSGITGFALAVTPPAFLFRTAVNEPLRVRIEEQSTAANSTTLARISLSWFAE